MPNDRELALIFWNLAVIVAVMVCSPEIRTATRELPRTAIHWKVGLSIVGAMSYIALEVWIGHEAGVWSWSLTTDTIFWCFGVALVALIDVNSAAKEEHFFGKAIVASVGTATSFSFLVNVFSLDLWGELLLMFVMILTGLLLLVTRATSGQEAALGPIRAILISVSIFLAVRAVYLIASDWRTLDHGGLIDSFLLPIWLIVGFAPWLYVVSLLSQYELIFLAIKLSGGGDVPLSPSGKLAVLRTLGLRIKKVSRFGDPWPVELAHAGTFTEARSILRTVREGRGLTEEPSAEIVPPAVDRRDALAVQLARFWSGGILSTSIELALKRRSAAE